MNETEFLDQAIPVNVSIEGVYNMTTSKAMEIEQELFKVDDVPTGFNGLCKRFSFKASLPFKTNLKFRLKVKIIKDFDLKQCPFPLFVSDDQKTL